MPLKLTNLQKVYWEEDNLTKGDLLDYYTKVGPIMLRYLRDRPLVLHRFPEGISHEGFYQKEAGKDLPPFVKTAQVAHKTKKISYIVVQNEKTLLYVANLGSIEFHPFNSRIQSLEHPDYVVLDLDPVDVAFDTVVDVALAAHAVLEECKIPNLCKTTGGKGLHIFVPLKGKHSYEEATQFAFLLAQIVHDKLPQITSLERSPKKRPKKVYLDYLQNHLGQTLVSAYSVRARAHATVSAPLLWKEVKHGLNPQKFTIKTLPKRLSQKGDLFTGILEKGVSLESCLTKLTRGKYGNSLVA